MHLKMEALGPTPGFISGIRSGAWKIAAQVVQAMKMLESDVVREVGMGPAQQAVSHDKECGFVLGAKTVIGRI